MNHRITTLTLAVTVVVGAWTLAISSHAQTTERQTVWSGVYTTAQADRGSGAYMDNCSPCHGPELEGVANLKGKDFMERWRELDVRDLYDWISKSMPRQRRGSTNRPGSLSESTYIDIIAHVFRANDFPAGPRPLAVDTMKGIHIERQDGPAPVPDGALVQSVGCLASRNSNWSLTNATEPTRTTSSEKSSDEELKRATTSPPGNRQFNLTNIGYASNFNPEMHVGEKVQTKGLLTRQPTNNRISVTSLESVATACP